MMFFFLSPLLGVDEYNSKTSGVSTRLTPLLNDGGIPKEVKIRLLMLYYLTEEKATEGRSRFEANARLTGDDEKILSNWLMLKDSTTRTVPPLLSSSLSSFLLFLPSFSSSSG